MNILITLSYTPFPIRRGTDRLVENLIDGLAARHNVFLATMYLDRETAGCMGRVERGNVSVRSILAPNRRSGAHRLYFKVKNLLRSAVTMIPPTVLYAVPPAYLDLIERTVHDERIDLVIAFYWHFYDLPERLPGVPVVLATQDIDYLVHPERLKRIRSPLRRLLAGVDSRMRERVEWMAYRRYDAVLTVTDADTEILRREHELSGKTILTLPLAIDLDAYDPSRFSRRADRLLVLGAFDSDFNADALRFLLRDVFPIVLMRRPEVVLEIVGQGAGRIIDQGPSRNVLYAGVVEDIRPYLGRCALMVLPLRFGGGVRIRMMEAAAMGTPVVSTPQGVAGMGLVKGKEYLEAGGPEEMAAAITGLIEDRTAANEIGRNARRWAEEHIAMDDYPDRLDALLIDVARSFSKRCM